MPKTIGFKEIRKIQTDQFQFILEIHHERRSSVRVSLAKEKAIVRIPLVDSVKKKEEHISWAQDWIAKKLTKDKNLIHRFQPRNYSDGEELTIRGKIFTLIIKENLEQKTATAMLGGSQIMMVIPGNLRPKLRQKTISTLVSKIMAKIFSREISQKVLELNEIYFRQKMGKIQLRNNQTNWGSCNTHGNISISSRLLMAPEFVLNYIIIHELAHTVHMNHSTAFWKVVAQAMPEYEAAEKWLDQNGDLCKW
ncbi:MAG: M48 family metallopeptidase [Bacteroidota bacterium]|nr:M48 family metallopeptidase [Bacteroidota bacterium]